MKNCPKCGAPVNDTAKFCPVCGGACSAPEQPQQNTQEFAQQSQQQYQQASQQRPISSRSIRHRSRRTTHMTTRLSSQPRIFRKTRSLPCFAT